MERIGGVGRRGASGARGALADGRARRWGHRSGGRGLRSARKPGCPRPAWRHAGSLDRLTRPPSGARGFSPRNDRRHRGRRNRHAPERPATTGRLARTQHDCAAGDAAHGQHFRAGPWPRPRSGRRRRGGRMAIPVHAKRLSPRGRGPAGRRGERKSARARSRRARNAGVRPRRVRSVGRSRSRHRSLYSSGRALGDSNIDRRRPDGPGHPRPVASARGRTLGEHGRDAAPVSRDARQGGAASPRGGPAGGRAAARSVWR